MKKEITNNIDKVIENLLDLSDDNKNIESTEESQKRGFFPRDFGMGFWDWPQGVGLYGLNKYNLELNTDMYQKTIDMWVNDRLEEATPIKNVNTTAPLLTLSKQGSKYSKLCNEWLEWTMTGLNRTSEGIIQHVTSNIDGTGVWLNDGEVWIDTIFMTLLFMNQMSINNEDLSIHHEAEYQILEHVKYLYNKNDKLFYHGFNFNGEHNFGEVYWCRGNSWFTFGMIDYLEQEKLVGRSNTAGYRYIENLYKNQVDRLLELRNDENLWCTVLTNTESYTEISGSAAIIAAILKGVRLEVLDNSVRSEMLESLEQLMTYIDEDGVVTGVSAGTGMGMDEQHYMNIIQSPMAYGQSLSLIALIEALHHV